MNQTESKNKRKLWLRILAAMMALLLIGTMILGWAVQIRFAQLEYLGTVLEHAAAVTEANTGYLSESTLQRAWNILLHAVGKPRSFEDYEMYASLSIARKEYGDAIGYMRGCIEHSPEPEGEDVGILYLRLGSLQALEEDPQSAIDSFTRAIEIIPDLADAYLLRAQMHSQLGQTDKAVEDIRAYDSLETADPAIRVSIGALYESAGEYDKAISCYTAGINRPELFTVDLLLSRARCYLLTGELEAAGEDLNRFFAEGGEDPSGDANVMQGICRMDSGDYLRAVNSFHSAIDKNHENTLALYAQCVLCAYVIGDYETVVSDGEKAIALMSAEGTQPSAEMVDGEEMTLGELYRWTGLAYMALADYSKAGQSFASALEHGDESEGLYYYIGLCHAAEDDMEKAIDAFTDSISKSEMVSLCCYNRGVCYLQSGKLEEGLTDLLTVLQLNDDAEAVSAADALLKEMDVEIIYETEKTTGKEVVD